MVSQQLLCETGWKFVAPEMWRRGDLRCLVDVLGVCVCFVYSHMAQFSWVQGFALT